MNGPEVLATSLDPGEAILAVTGVRPLLTNEVERIRAPDWREIGQLDERISRLAQQLCRGTLEKAAGLEAVNYQPYLKAFEQTPNVDQIMAMVQDIPVPLVMPYLTVVKRAYNYLRDRFPVVSEKTIFGTERLEPGDFALGMFEDLLGVIDNPLSVFHLLDEGSLTTRQAQAIRDVYPTIFDELAISLVERCSQEKAAKKSWEPEFSRGMSLILGVPGVDPNLRTQLANLPPQQAKPPPRARPAKSQRAELIATSDDKLDLEGG